MVLKILCLVVTETILSTKECDVSIDEMNRGNKSFLKRKLIVLSFGPDFFELRCTG